MGQENAAIAPVNSAIKLSPNAFSPKLNLGIAFLETQQFANAETQLRQCVKISSTPIAHMYLGLVLAQLHEDVDAEKEFKNAIGSGGDQMAQAHKYLGGLY